MGGSCSKNARMQTPKDAFSWKPRSGKRKQQGRPLITWKATCKNDLQTIGVDWDDAARVKCLSPNATFGAIRTN